jgi:diguanylate cyclase (GGDEF)-like protein/PAS domain S-box-containing protein
MFVAMLVLMVVAAQRGTPMFERYLLVVGMFLVGGVLILRSSLLAARHRGLLASEREALSALSQTRAASARYFGISRDLLSSATLDGRFQEVNPAWESLLGWTQEEMIDRQFMELVHPDDLERTAEQTTQIVTTGAPMMEFENRFRAKDGTYRWLSWRSQYDRDSDLLYVRGSDATERKVLEQELEQLALHDAVTGLPNRTLFADRAAHALASADRDDGCVGMLFIDLDNFKFVNDSYGHEAGDTLLRTVATRLASVLRPHDTVARFAGDEFTVLCPGIAGAGEGSAIGHRILSALGHPIKLGENEIVVSGSVGLAVGHGLDKSVDTLMSEADTAMYRAKEGGRARVEIFDDALRAVASRKMRLERDLRVALDNGDFHLVYQPIVTLDTGYLDKFEALLRWEHPELGAVGPDEFVPIAEETGLIVEIGRWVAEEACRALAGATRSGVGMALNLSARQLLDPGLAGHLVYAATEAGISPELIDLEITETMLVDERQPVLDAIDALKWAGFRLVLDDFGTGYSALGYLKRLPFDLIKIDRSFVAELHASDEDAAIVAAIVAVAQALDLDVVAEGIETPEQLEHLRSLGVAYGQGFHFSHPVPPSDIPAVMTLRPPSPVARLPRRGDRSVAPAG